jgi:uncharacterized UBP type Zn finger protein
MLHRIINWITNPFKKKEVLEPTYPTYVVPLSEKEINEIKSSLMCTVKEYKEAVKNAMEQVEETKKSETIVANEPEIVSMPEPEVIAHPETEEVIIPQVVIPTEKPKAKRKSYYKKKSSSKKKETN